MKSRYLYKAKSLSGEWVHGYYINRIETHSISGRDLTLGVYYICPSDSKGELHVIDIKTLCQCTGMMDLTSKYIYEHDIVEYIDKKNGMVSRYEVRWHDFMGCYVFAYYDFHDLIGYCPGDTNISGGVRVIGNTIDNPELDPVSHSLYDANVEWARELDEVPEDEAIITMENYRDFGLYSKDDVIEIISKALSKS